jgi:AcrR family transcriptional regulator
LIHEAFIYSSDEEYAEVLAPFLAEAAAGGQVAVAVTSPERGRLLQEALGSDRASVSFFDAEQWYSRPGATLAAWRATLDGHPAAQTVRVVGEIPLNGDTATVARWMSYESLFNRAFADRDAWVICAYDARTLPEEIVANARRTHPVVSTGAGRAPSPEHFAGHELGARLTPSVARADVRHGATTTVGLDSDPIELRRAVTWAARSAGVSEDVLEDLILAINELARASAGANVRTGQAGGEWFCEVAITGRSSGELPLDENGLGVLVGRLICESVEIDEGKDRRLVRFVFGRPRADARLRILGAGAELFCRDGVRATSVDAIIAQAGVAKATFYAHFPSKNELVLAWLRSSSVRWFDGVRAEVEARATTPVERLTLFFDVLGEWLAADDFRGCQILNTAAEEHYAEPTRRSLAELQGEIEGYLRSAATDAGLPDSDRLASQLLLLVPGTITAAATQRSTEPAAVAREAATSLVAAAQ